MAPGSEPFSVGVAAMSSTADNGNSRPSLGGVGAISLPPYPDRFYSAAAYAGVPEAFGSSPDAKTATARGFSDETKLILYSLYQQATVGPCNTSKPWGWNIAETAKWTSWKQLGNMAPVEAMRLFVRTLEEEDPTWWSRFSKAEEGKSDELGLQDASAEAEAPPETSPLKQLKEEAKDQPATEDGGVLSAAAEAVANGLGASPTPLVMEQPPPPPPSDVPSSNGSTPKAKDDPFLAEGLEAIEVYNQWICPSINGRRPTPRYQHAAAVLGRKMYVIGGNLGGRYLSDIQVLDLDTLTWSKIDLKGTTPTPPPSSPLPEMPPAPTHALAPCAGHSLIPWGKTLLAIAGHTKEGLEKVAVRVFDTEMLTWSTLAPTGDIPVARGGQSISLYGTRIIMFGGEDPKRRLLNDVHILDLPTMTWERVTTKGTPPSPRCDHVAEVYDGRYFFVFGGGSHANCYSDLHVLDLESMEWSQPQCQGTLPSPRAGHAAVAIGDYWYIVGGGDNARGISDMLMLDMTMLKWSIVASAPAKTSIASEGLSIVAGPEDGYCVIVFGGYNGRYSNEVHVFKPAVAEKSKPRLIESPAAAAAAAAATAAATVPGDLTARSLPDVMVSEAPQLDGEPQTRDGTMSFLPASSLISTLDASHDEQPFMTAAVALGGKARTGGFSFGSLSQSPPAQEEEVVKEQVDSGSPSANDVKKAEEDELKEQQLAAAIKEKEEAQAEAMSANTENARLRKDLALARSQLADSEQELQSVRGLLGSEQSRSFRLEVEVAELRKKLQQMETLEKELDLLRRQQEESEVAASAASAAASRQNSGGMWSWLAGSPPESK